MLTTSKLATIALVTAISIAAFCPVDAATSHRHRGAGHASGSARLGARGAGPVGNDVVPGGGPVRTKAAPGGEDGGAGGYGQVGNPYSQAGYGAGAFGSGQPRR